MRYAGERRWADVSLRAMRPDKLAPRVIARYQASYRFAVDVAEGIEIASKVDLDGVGWMGAGFYAKDGGSSDTDREPEEGGCLVLYLEALGEFFARD